jgi:hypothetical protein
MKFSDYTKKYKNLKNEPPAIAPARRENPRFKSSVVRRTNVHYTAAVTSAPPKVEPAKAEADNTESERQKKIHEIEKILSGKLPNEIIYPERFYRRHWV